MSGSSPWNAEPLSFSPNTNTMDKESMPSAKAEAARAKAAEVMAALKKGEPGEADKIMGAQKETGTKGIIPLGALSRKLGFGKKNKEEGSKEQGKVVR